MRSQFLLAVYLIAAGCSRYSVDGDGPAGGDDSRDAPADDSAPPLPDEEVIDAGFSFGEPRPCDDPADTVRYTEVGEEWGLADARVVDPDNETSGGALAVLDHDHDGDLDLLVGHRSQDVVLYENAGDLTFTATTLTGIGCVGTALNVADLDGDGWEDLLVGKPPTLVRNDAGTWDTAAPVFLTWEGDAGAMELAPGDLDGDGLPEIYALTNTSSEAADNAREDVLFRNLGGFAFEEVPDGVPDDPVDGKGFDALWYDEDQDGDLDIYVSNDVGSLYGENVLWRNDGGTLRQANDDCGCGLPMTGMGIDAGDYDGDGQMDLFLTHGAGETMLRRMESGVYVDVTLTAGITSEEMGWGAVYFDRENDGDLDVLVALGNITFDGELDGAPGDGLALMEQQDGSFADVAAEVGLDAAGDDQGSYRSTVVVDVNDDGVLDLVAGEVHRRPKVYLSDACTAANWLRVEAPVGTRVQVQAGAHTWYDEVMHDSGRGSAGPASVHVGLGDQAVFHRLHLTLPDGRTVRAEGAFDARRVVRFEE